MNESKHTPGQWEVKTFKREFPQEDGSKRFDVFVKVMSPSGEEVHYKDGFNVTLERANEIEANARLIAKAPELLEALEKTTKALDDLTNELWSTHCDLVHKEDCQLIDQCKELLAKAKGEST